MGCVDDMEDLTVEQGCKVRSLPSFYFGVLLGASFKTVTVWDGVD